MGNLHSVTAAIARNAPAATVHLTDDAQTIARADKIIFPGDGHFDACVEQIDARGLRACLVAAITAGTPFLGICVGMQVLYAASEEGQRRGLGILPDTIVRLPAAGQKIPHIGWNTTHHHQPHAWTQGVAGGERFYYVHSYCAPITATTLMTATYGVAFSAVIARDNLWATQFHPEKSGQAGQALLAHFLHAA